MISQLEEMKCPLDAYGKGTMVPDLLCTMYFSTRVVVCSTYILSSPPSSPGHPGSSGNGSILLRLLPGLPKGRSASMLIYHMFAHKQL